MTGVLAAGPTAGPAAVPTAHPAAGPTADPAAVPAAGPTAHPAAGAADRVAALRRTLAWGAVVLPAAVAAVLVAAGIPDYARLVTPEQAPVTWFQTVLLAVAAVLAGLAAAGRWVAGEPARPWVALAAGLGWLAVDDRFAVHERLRDGFLAGRVPDVVPWGAPGDVVLLAYGVAGLFVVRAVARELAVDGGARTAFVAGIALLGTAVAVDTVDPASLTHSGELALATVEECLELFGDAAVALSVGLVAIGRAAPTGAPAPLAPTPPSADRPLRRRPAPRRGRGR